MAAPGRPLLVGGSGVPEAGWIVGSLDHAGRKLNLLEEGVDTMPGCSDGGVTIAFPGRPAAGLPWGNRAWESLEEDVNRVATGPGRLLLRGHHQHVLADAPGCLRWLERCDEASLSCGIALSPASMLAPSMVEARDDHLVRMFEYLGARAEVVILEDLSLDDPDQLVGRPVGLGILPGPLLGTLLEAHVAQEVPVVILGHDLDVAHEWLWPS